MTQKKPMTKKRKRILIIAGGILIVFIIVLAGVNSYFGYKIKNLIKAKINENPDSTLAISYSSINVNIYTGLIRINDLLIEPGKKKTERFRNGELKSIFSLKLKSFRVSGIDILGFMTKKKLHIGKITIKDADINLIVNNALKTDKLEIRRDTLDIFSEKIKGITINEINFKDIDLRVSDIKQEKDPFIKLNSLSISLMGVKVDSTTINNSIPASYNSFALQTRKFVYNKPKFYSIIYSGLNFNMKDSTLNISDFQLKPKYSKASFDKRIPYETDLFDIKTKAIIINRIGILSFLSNKELNIPSMEILDPNIDIYRNKRITDPPYKYKPLLVTLIKKISVPILLDTLKIKNGKLIYGELHEYRDKPGEVEFSNLNINGYNITNRKKQIALHPIFRLDVSSKLMGKANFQVNFRFDQSKTNDFFTVDGEMGRIIATEINRVSESMMRMKIKSGVIHKASFHFWANNDQSKGELIMDYENLKIEVMKVDERKSYKALSAIANGVMNNHNIPGKKKYKTGLIHFSRDKNKAIPNYLWKSIQSGLVSIMASVAESKDQKEIRKGKQGKKTKRNEKRTDKKTARLLTKA